MHKQRYLAFARQSVNSAQKKTKQMIKSVDVISMLCVIARLGSSSFAFFLLR